MRCVRIALLAAGAALALNAPIASGGSFPCTRAITSAQATAILGVPSQVVAGGGAEDDCGINARGFSGIGVTGYVVKRSFFDDMRRKTRTGTNTSEGIRVVHTQRALQGFGAPAFSVDTKSFFGPIPTITRSVFVYRNGRMLRPTTTTTGPARVASIAQLVQIARIAARSI